MTPTWFHNRQPVENVPIDDRGFQYGDGLFETIAIRAGRPRLWPFHWERLARGCEQLGLGMPVEADLHDQLAVALKVAGADASNGIAKDNSLVPGQDRAVTHVPTRRSRASLSAYSPARRCQGRPTTDGVDAIVCETRLAGPSALAGLKTLNRLEQVLGRSECAAVNAFEGLMIDADERVICGTMSNVFIVIGHTIITPSLERCGVAGVMRRQVLESFSGSDRAITIRDVALEELMGSDEVFLSNSQFGVVPLRRCADRQWSPGGSTRECQRLLAKQGVQECAL